MWQKRTNLKNVYIACLAASLWLCGSTAVAQEQSISTQMTVNTQMRDDNNALLEMRDAHIKEMDLLLHRYIIRSRTLSDVGELHIRSERFRSIDVNSLEAVMINDPSAVYGLAPIPKPNYYARVSHYNLLTARDLPMVDPFSIDLRVTKKISLEMRNNVLDAVAIVFPLQRRISLGVGHRFTKDTSFYTFYDPISQEVLGVFSHFFNARTEMNILLYHDHRIDKSDIIGTLKFRF